MMLRRRTISGLPGGQPSLALTNTSQARSHCRCAGRERGDERLTEVAARLPNREHAYSPAIAENRRVKSFGRSSKPATTTASSSCALPQRSTKAAADVAKTCRPRKFLYNTIRALLSAITGEMESKDKSSRDVRLPNISLYGKH